jgi:uncharacterized membrane protein
MRKNHIIGGVIVYGVGIFLVYLYRPYVIEFVKGAIQPIFILISLVAMAATIFGNRKLRKINLTVFIVFLFLGLYGFYDEYYAVVDFFNGLLPPLLVATGLIAVVQGIKKLT